MRVVLPDGALTPFLRIPGRRFFVRFLCIVLFRDHHHYLRLDALREYSVLMPSFRGVDTERKEPASYSSVLFERLPADSMFRRDKVFEGALRLGNRA
jgi:hypothetical protein